MNKKKEELEKINKWVVKEITSREYTTKELETVALLLKKKDHKGAWKILLKGHKCPRDCSSCQEALTLPVELTTPTNTWQEKTQRAEQLANLAEKEVKEAEQLRIKEATNLLFNNPKEFFKHDRKPH